jgi:hypothetical protein
MWPFAKEPEPSKQEQILELEASIAQMKAELLCYAAPGPYFYIEDRARLSGYIARQEVALKYLKGMEGNADISSK